MPRNFPELSLRRHYYSQVEPCAGWLQSHLDKPGRRAIPHRTDQSGAHSLRDPEISEQVFRSGTTCPDFYFDSILRRKLAGADDRAIIPFVQWKIV